MTVAISLIAAIGQIERFASPQKLVSYFGLNPSVRQSGLAPARHGHITKIGRAQARGMLVEAAWAAAHTPGPLRAFFLRIRALRGMQIAAVAAARKLAIITWHVLTKNEDYDWVRPALTQKKMRALELQSGFKPTPGSNRGRAYDYNLAAVRASECAASEHAEEGNHVGPMPAPERCYGSKPRAPGAVLKGLQRGVRGLGIGGTVDRLELFGDRLAVFPGTKIQGIADQMHNAGLDLRLGKYGINRLRKSKIRIPSLLRSCVPGLGICALLQTTPGVSGLGPRHLRRLSACHGVCSTWILRLFARACNLTL